MTDDPKTDAKMEPKEMMRTLSRYELVMIASREARRLNETARLSGKELKRRVTDVAWERLEGGKINYTYSEEPIADPALEAAPDLAAEMAAEAAAKAEEIDDEAPDLVPAEAKADAAPETTPDEDPKEPSDEADASEEEETVES